MPQAINRNTLFYGDNLRILREYIQDNSIDLVYLDPPFNSQRTYNVLFRDESGQESDAQIAAFDDTWHWTIAAEEAYHELVTHGSPEVSTMVSAMRSFIGTNQMMAYLVMMAIRLVELHRVLKPTGSLYLHCDPTASHYLKVILDTIFGVRYYRNEIIWERYGSHNDPKRYGRITDTIFFYTKSDDFVFNTVHVPYSEEHLQTRFKQADPDGRRFWANTCLAPGGRGPRYEWNGHVRNWRFTIENMRKLDEAGYIYYSNSGMPYRKNYLDELPGQPAQNLWTDIKMTRSGSERLGYPTQKPEALLERIIKASSNEGDLVLDPFCGCGTTIAAAQRLKRRWVGIDITHLSIALQKYRLRDSFSIVAGRDYDVIGEPVSLGSARELAQADRYQFQWWALSLIQARPLGGDPGAKKGRKGADQGIDGMITFIDDATGNAKRVLVQVKSGKVGSRDIRDLVGTVKRENAAIGVFITLEEPSGPMVTEAASAGFYHSPGWDRDYPRIQIATVEALLEGKRVEMPSTSITFQQAPKRQATDASQPGLFDEG